MWSKDSKNTSWKRVGGWYNKIVGDSGHYYHEKVIMPNSLRLLNLKSGERLIDVACGQGVLARVIPQTVKYLGIDLALNLIQIAKDKDKNKNHQYLVADAARDHDWGLTDKIAIILGLQNMKKPFGVIRNCARSLKNNGKLLIVLNHPAFRIPKHSDWIVKSNSQYRIVNNYMSGLEIPIDTSPFDKKDNQISWSFHNPLSVFSEMLFDNGFLIEKIEEWVSPKKSTGSMAKIEDRARREIPLFMAIMAVKR